jgi:hypothetical protein
MCIPVSLALTTEGDIGMLRIDCAHLKQAAKGIVVDGKSGSLRCGVDRAEPDSSTRAGMNCPSSCMAYRKAQYSKGEPVSAVTAIKNAVLSILGK